MNKFKFLIAALFVSLPLLVSGVFASSAYAQTSESISNFQTDITINKDSTLNVAETIDYDFGTTQHHGMFQTIPYKAQARGGTFKYRYSNFVVTDEKNQPIQFDNSTSGNDIILKVGDPNTYVTGKHVYKISYTVGRAINYFSDHDELYWNVVGTKWTVPIAKASVVVHGPANITRAECFTGELNSKEKNCSIAGVNTNTVTITGTQSFPEGEGMTMVVALPAGTLTQPTTAQKFWDIVKDNGVLMIPILVFILMFAIWYKWGRDPKSKNPIVAQYEAPDKLSPMYMGALLHNKVTNQDLAAEIVYLAEQGFLTIERIETKSMLGFRNDDYRFASTGKLPESLPDATAYLLSKIFLTESSVLMSDLKTVKSFGLAIAQIKKDTIDWLSQQQYFRTNPVRVQHIMGIVGVVLIYLAIHILGSGLGVIGIVSGILSAIIIFAFGRIMPAYSEHGADVVALIKGLKLYLSVAEKDRLKFANAPDKDPKQFEKLLPYAIALGVEKEWAAQFKDLTNAPSWYTDSTGNMSTFNALYFANSMGDFSSSMQGAVTTVTTASSGGSGFGGGGGVGGGGGGGGGGSW